MSNTLDIDMKIQMWILMVLDERVKCQFSMMLGLTNSKIFPRLYLFMKQNIFNVKVLEIHAY